MFYADVIDTESGLMLQIT